MVLERLFLMQWVCIIPDVGIGAEDRSPSLTPVCDRTLSTYASTTHESLIDHRRVFCYLSRLQFGNTHAQVPSPGFSGFDVEYQDREERCYRRYGDQDQLVDGLRVLDG